jgi:hypothetical protein
MNFDLSLNISARSVVRIWSICGAQPLTPAGGDDEDSHLGSTTNCAVDVTSSTKGQPITETLEMDSLCKLYSRSVVPFLNDKVRNVVWFIRSLQTVLDYQIELWLNHKLLQLH